MDDALLVRFVNRGTDLIEDVSDPLEWQTLFFREHVAERAAVEILHHEVSDLAGVDVCETKVSHVNHVRMAKTSRGARFAFEALDEFVVAHKLRRNEF